MSPMAIAPDQDVVIVEVFIAAPPARVFEAITDSNQTPQWWGQQGNYRITEWQADLRPGGKWSSVGANSDGTSIRVDGEYIEVDPPRLLVHTWNAPWCGNLETVVRWELEPTNVHGLHPSGPKRAGTGTLLRIRHQGFALSPQSAKGHAQGWARVLGWMQAYLENGLTIDERPALVK